MVSKIDALECTSETLIKALEAIIAGTDRDNNEGICGNVDRIIAGSILNKEICFYSCFVTWPHFSGSYSYPVPDPEKCMDSDAAFYQNNKWEGTYGELRLDLARHILQEISKPSRLVKWFKELI